MISIYALVSISAIIPAWLVNPASFLLASLVSYIRSAYSLSIDRWSAPFGTVELPAQS